MFHGDLLARRAMFPPLRQELLLSHAVLAYARALGTGHWALGTGHWALGTWGVSPTRRTEAEALLAEPVDVPAALDAALDRADPLAVIEALAPATPTYLALRQALHRYRAGGQAEAAAVERLRLIEANLERERWLSRRLPADRVLGERG